MDGPTIGILSPDMTGWYHGLVVAGAQRKVAAAGGKLLVVSTGTYRFGRRELPRVGWGRAQGFLVRPDAVPESYLKALAEAGKPVVALAYQPDFPCPAVIPDDIGGVTQAVDHLVDHGHTVIAFAGGPKFYSRDRYKAFCAALRARGIEPRPGLRYESRLRHEFVGRDLGEKMVAAGLPSTAAVVDCDLHALGIMEVLRASGYLLPRDQAIVGFDNMPARGGLSPALSSCSQDVEEMGCLAATLLLQMTAGEAVEARPYVVRGPFVARESCGCVSRPGVAPAGPAPRGAAERRFRGAIDKLVVEREAGPSGSGGRAGLLAGFIASTLRRASTDDLGAQEGAELSAACSELSSLAPYQEISDVVLRYAQEVAAELLAEARSQGTASSSLTSRLNGCLSEVHLGLAKTAILERDEAYYELRRTVHEEHEVSLELLRSHESDPRNLAWLAKTKASTGVLALWGEGESKLNIVGTYSVGGDAALRSPGPFQAEEFPPTEVLQAARGHDIVLVVPIKSQERDWGALALAVPPTSGFLGADTYFEWDALLAEALDYEAALASLRERSRELHERGEQLALSYRREREMAQAVRESEERYALAALAANEGLIDWDLSTGAVYYSPRWCEMLGYRTEEVGSAPGEWFDRAHPEDRGHLLAELGSLKVGTCGSVLLEHRLQTKKGQYIWALSRCVAVPGMGRTATRIVSSVTDITGQRVLEERLRHQALYDALTGLPNRVLFLDRLSHALSAQRRCPSKCYTVLWLDLDGFKVLNDSLGHNMGDRLLVRVAKRIRSELRECDTAARFGGDEFAVLLVDIADVDTIQTVVKRLLAHLAKPYDLDGHDIVVSASVGVATSANGYKRPEDVLRDADIAMYRAKSKGRDTFAIFDSSMRATALSRLETESELRKAIAPRALAPTQMELHYQPIVDLASSRPLAVEALVRWLHPERGLLRPSEFLAVAEDSGLIVPLGRWVMSEACDQLSRWASSGITCPTLRVSLNLSNREFWGPDLLEHLDAVLARTGTDPQQVSFEITEGVIIDNLERATAMLDELHSRGLEVYVDDFGTGYSSLHALQRLSIDALKIDQSFVAGLGCDERTGELVRTIVQLGNNLGVRVIAEGIETPQQRQWLADVGCSWGQGYLFCPPLPASRLGALLSAPGLSAPGPSAPGPSAPGLRDLASAGAG
ncbi:MAG TPA: EAL domain-containing protein [Acidimicrobiales bacterium]|nr:EAL domain-containing protein [Acidimicrobiales bacterium]